MLNLRIWRTNDLFLKCNSFQDNAGAKTEKEGEKDEDKKEMEKEKDKEEDKEMDENLEMYRLFLLAWNLI